jgi:hypothetical protein
MPTLSRLELTGLPRDLLLLKGQHHSPSKDDLTIRRTLEANSRIRRIVHNDRLQGNPNLMLSLRREDKR